jgi:hypothetical protein
MSSKKLWKRLILRWYTRKAAVILILFLLLAIFIEYAIVRFSLSLGVTDVSMLTKTLRFPDAGMSFTIAISPLFHLIPVGVVITLVFSWMHLAKHIAVRPRKITPEKKASEEKKRLRLERARRFFEKVEETLESVSRKWRRLFFAQAAVKSALGVLAVFVVVVFVVYVTVYPDLIGDLTVDFYNGSPPALETVAKTVDFAGKVGQVLTPLGWLASLIDSALKTAAPEFRSVIQGFGTSISPLVRMDAVEKYILCQNIAAWAPALITLTYGQYVSHFRRRSRKR